MWIWLWLSTVNCKGCRKMVSGTFLILKVTFNIDNRILWNCWKNIPHCYVPITLQDHLHYPHTLVSKDFGKINEAYWLLRHVLMKRIWCIEIVPKHADYRIKWIIREWINEVWLHCQRMPNDFKNSMSNTWRIYSFYVFPTMLLPVIVLHIYSVKVFIFISTFSSQ